MAGYGTIAVPNGDVQVHESINDEQTRNDVSTDVPSTNVWTTNQTSQNYFLPLIRRATSPAVASYRRRQHQQDQIISSPLIKRLSSILPTASHHSSTTSVQSTEFSSSSHHQNEAHDVFQFAVRLAMDAYSYGCVGYRIEVFLEKMLLDHGYECSIIVTNVELIASIYSYRWKKRKRKKKAKTVTIKRKGRNVEEKKANQKPPPQQEDDDEGVEHFLPITIAIPLVEGHDLNKLGELSSVCHKVLSKQLPLSQAMNHLDEIESLPPPWNVCTKWLAYLGTSIGFVAILGGSWIDLYISMVGSTMTFWVVQIFSTFVEHDTVQRLHVTWQNFLAAFLPTLLASVVSKLNLFQSPVNVTTVAISCIISEVPGFMLLKGVSELSRNRILAGFGHFINALFISFWLGLGGWVGMEFVNIVFGLVSVSSEEKEAEAPSIQERWLILFGPVLCSSFAIFFNVSTRDLMPSTLVGLIALSMTMTTSYFPNAFFGNFISAVATALSSHLWSYLAASRADGSHSRDTGSFMYKPESIFGLPAFFTLACGSMGFLGFLGLLEGDSTSGTQAFVKMLTLTFILVFGVYVGGTVLPTKAVLNAW